MKAIGGYFELELNQGNEIHHNCIRLNSGTNCLEYILRAKKYRRIYLPHYTCEAIPNRCKALGIEIEYYHIDINLDPILEVKYKPEAVVLYTNYFGIKNSVAEGLQRQYPNLIIDNAQAFFCENFKRADSFYSARKYFGVPDGAYLYTNKSLDILLAKDKSAARVGHLLKRIENGASQGFSDFKANEDFLSREPMKSMSTVTHSLLCSIDYKNAIRKRQDNFWYLHQHLSKVNMMTISEDRDMVPMVYPFLYERAGLRDHLIANKIYVATYWPGILESMSPDDLEYFLARNLVPLPIDQRYDVRDMKRVVSKIFGYV